jgi:hypothetical protein
MFIPDPDLDFLPIPDPGIKTDPGIKKAPGSRIWIRNTDFLFKAGLVTYVQLFDP